MRSTAEGIAKLFQSPAIAAKTTYIPMGIRYPAEYQRHEPSKTVNLLFTNSWHQAADSFYFAGASTCWKPLPSCGALSGATAHTQNKAAPRSSRAVPLHHSRVRRHAPR